MSVDHVDETTGEAAREAAGEAVRAQAVTALRYYAVAPGVRLNVRSGPGTGYPIVKVLPEGIKVPVYCQTPGTWVSGYYGTTNIWDNIGNGEFVSDSYVQTGSDGYIAPRCA
ncbi:MULTISPECIES: SH3 domain-containing protein [unclassified Streptomyces]|uniref:SH3 domain-containing protein n=1 Tax=unclassified Streptomyces TaxID=2593676 RepID=UPI0037021F39